MDATVAVGPKGGIEYRLWTEGDTYRIVSKFKALPHLSPEEKAKAETMERERKARSKADADHSAFWRDMMRGG